MSTKVILTNWSVLKCKYLGSLGAIRQAIDAVVRADKARGVRTRLIRLDVEADMMPMDASAVADPRDPRRTKAAVDAVCRAVQPDYVMLLGAPDVIPHQDLINPLAWKDGEERAWGDLPYACDVPYSQNIAAFRGPTRVVGRLPGLARGTDPGCLLEALAIAAEWTPYPPAEYRSYFGLSAHDWTASTQLSLEYVFGSGEHLFTSPPGGPKWPEEVLGHRSHLVNCHGLHARPYYYGHLAADAKPALSAAWTMGRVRRGTVAAVECCFGAQLYDPAEAGGQMGIANAYLASGAYGFFGSTCTSYGASAVNGLADLICRFFLTHVRLGESLGRAALHARQEFISFVGTLTPMAAKTLAQFILLGDPSVHPVLAPSDTHPVPAGADAALPAEALALRTGRAERRHRLAARGLALARATPAATVARPLAPPAAARRELEQLAGQEGMDVGSLHSYPVRVPRGVRLSRTATPPPDEAQAFHVIAQDTTPPGSPMRHLAVLEAREVGGKIVSYSTFHSK